MKTKVLLKVCLAWLIMTSFSVQVSHAAALYGCPNGKLSLQVGETKSIRVAYGYDEGDNCTSHQWRHSEFGGYISVLTSDSYLSSTAYITGLAPGVRNVYVDLYKGYDFWGTMTCEVTVTAPPGIQFADAKVKALCVANWDTNGDGGLSEAEAAAVTSLGEVFYHNTEITSFNELQYFTGLTEIGTSAFSCCYSLTSITIPNSVTSIGNGAFTGCTSLTSITIPNSVTSIDYLAFYGCYGLTSITIPNSVTSIGYTAFLLCSNLTSIVVESGNTKYDSRDNCNAIIESATNTLIEGCKNSTIPYSVTSIGECAFGQCSGLTSITMPNSVTSIGRGAFSECSDLTSVTISESVTNIGYEAFDYCESLTDVYCYAQNVPMTGNNVFKNTPIASATLHVPASAIQQYQTTTPWSSFGSIVPIDDTPIPTSISLNNTSISLEVGETKQLTATVLPNEASQSVTWSSDTPDVATVEDGKVTAVGLGQAVITASATEDSNIKANCTIIVVDAEDTDISQLDNVIYLEPTEVQAGTTTTLSFRMKNSAAIRAFQFDLYLPEGMTAAKNSKGKFIAALSNGRLPEDDEHTLTIQEQTNGSIRFLCNSLYDETFTGNEGEIFTLTVIVADDVVTSEYPVVMKDMRLTEIDASKYYEHSYIKTTLRGPGCATPTIIYAGGKLKFSCETEGVEFVSTITDDDIKSYNTEEVELSATYTISVYATKPGYTDSEVVTGTLCWIEQQPTTENIVDEDAVTEVKALPVLIQTRGGIVTIQGVDNGTEVFVYSTDGKKEGSAISIGNQAVINTNLTSGSIAIVKIGEKSIKVLVK